MALSMQGIVTGLATSNQLLQRCPSAGDRLVPQPPSTVRPHTSGGGHKWNSVAVWRRQNHVEATDTFSPLSVRVCPQLLARRLQRISRPALHEPHTERVSCKWTELGEKIPRARTSWELSRKRHGGRRQLWASVPGHIPRIDLATVFPPPEKKLNNCSDGMTAQRGAQDQRSKSKNPFLPSRQRRPANSPRTQKLFTLREDKQIIARKRAEKEEAERQEELEAFRTAFRVIDADQSGAVQKSEALSVLHSFGKELVRPIQPLAIHAGSFVELTSILHAGHMSWWPQDSCDVQLRYQDEEEFWEKFNKFDSDKSSAIDEDEFCKLMSELSAKQKKAANLGRKDALTWRTAASKIVRFNFASLKGLQQHAQKRTRLFGHHGDGSDLVSGEELSEGSKVLKDLTSMARTLRDLVWCRSDTVSLACEMTASRTIDHSLPLFAQRTDAYHLRKTAIKADLLVDESGSRMHTMIGQRTLAITRKGAKQNFTNGLVESQNAMTAMHNFANYFEG